MSDSTYEQLKEDLRRWGNAMAARAAVNDHGCGMGDSVLARQRDFGLASKRKVEVEHKIVGRSGEDRRRYMAAKASTSKLRLSILPIWAVDPVPARNDAAKPFDRSALPVDLVPDDLQWVNRAMARLTKDFPMRAAIVRMEFCEPGTHRMKAGRVERQYGGTLSVRQYRYELQRALDWMNGRMAA